MSGRLDGTAKYYYTSGAIESRMYENGVLQVGITIRMIAMAFAGGNCNENDFNDIFWWKLQ